MVRFRFTQSLHRRLRCTLPICVALGCRTADVLPPPELTGTLVAVRLISSSGTTSGISVIEIAARDDSVRVVWKRDAPGCLLASASAAYTGRLLLIEIARSGDPLADCAPGAYPRTYEARTARLPAGTYEVRVVDAFAGRARAEVGRAIVSLASK